MKQVPLYPHSGKAEVFLYNTLLPLDWQSFEINLPVPTFTPENATFRVLAGGRKGCDNAIVIITDRETREVAGLIRVKDSLEMAQAFFEAHLVHIGMDRGSRQWKRLVQRARKGMGFTQS